MTPAENSAVKAKEEIPSKKRKTELESQPEAKKTRTNVQDDPDGAKTLFVGNLSWNVDDEWLSREFQESEGFVSCRVMTDRNSGKSRG